MEIDLIFYFAYIGYALWYWCGFTVGKNVEKRKQFNNQDFNNEENKYCYTAKGKELIFITNIQRDGSGTKSLANVDMKHLNETVFKISCLSITNRTYDNTRKKTPFA
jgi:hypothetical protein